MRLVYSHSHDGNFGDDLNAILWPRLFPQLGDAGGDNTALVGVGTIIGMPVAGADTLHVLSSGVGYDNLDNWSGKTVRYWSVRGRLSAQMLGLPADKGIGDGAYLMPLIVEGPGGPRADKPIVIPHLDSIRVGGWEDAVRLAGFDLVDPRGDPPSVISRIAGARLVLTESLHGAIIADAFGVDWIPFSTSKNFSAFKWADWLSTLDQRVLIHCVPPPRPQMLALYGRRNDEVNTEIDAFLTGEAAFGLAGGKDDSDASPLRRRVKIMATGFSGAGLMLGAHPAKTAEALSRLAARDPITGRASRVDSIQSKLLDVVRAFGRETGADLSREFS